MSVGGGSPQVGVTTAKRGGVFRKMGRNVIEAARSSGVTHIVMHSVMSPRIQVMPHHWNKHLVEQQLVTSDMDFTILQPASYMQNVRGVWGEVIAGRYPVPYPTGAQFSPVELGDVAEVAAEMICGSGHAGMTYELCGPERLTSDQMAACMGRALGRSVEAVEIERAEWRRDTELDPERADTLLRMFEYYAEHGFSGDSAVLTRLLGRAPTSFVDYLRRSIREGRSPGPPAESHPRSSSPADPSRAEQA